MCVENVEDAHDGRLDHVVALGRQPSGTHPGHHPDQGLSKLGDIDELGSSLLSDPPLEERRV